MVQGSKSIYNFDHVTTFFLGLVQPCTGLRARVARTLAMLGHHMYWYACACGVAGATPRVLSEELEDCPSKNRKQKLEWRTWQRAKFKRPSRKEKVPHFKLQIKLHPHLRDLGTYEHIWNWGHIINLSASYSYIFIPIEVLWIWICRQNFINKLHGWRLFILKLVSKNGVNFLQGWPYLWVLYYSIYLDVIYGLLEGQIP